MYKALYISPMIPSFDFEVTGKFFEEVMGFTKVYSSEIYLIFEKDNLTIHILRAGENIGEMEFYLEVDNIDEVWNGIKDKLENVKHKEPHNREYKMREAHIIIPATKCLMFIGQSI
ncbi:MAG TPA: hypothetical protein PLG90_03265 [Ignavibacteria bacterium]|nr:hypothetical protein [Ignavibacteria bacterium]